MEPAPQVSMKYLKIYHNTYIKCSSTMQDENVVLSDNPDRVRTQITGVVAQIRRFDFDCNLVAA